MERGVFCFIFFYEVAAVVLVLVVEDVVVEDPTSSTGSLPKRGFPTSPPPLSPLSWNRLYGLHTWHSSCVGGTAFTASPTVHMAPKAQQQRSPRSIFTYTSSLQLCAAVLPEKCNHKCWWLVIWWPKSSQGRTRERISHKAAHFPLFFIFNPDFVF